MSDEDATDAAWAQQELEESQRWEQHRQINREFREWSIQEGFMLKPVSAKRCTHCDAIKPKHFFQVRPAMADGYLNQCKECVATYRNEWNRTHRASMRDAYRRWASKPDSQHSIESLRQIARRWFPEKHKARDAVNNAIKDGRLTKRPCEVCADSNVEAHHDDYSKPLHIRWLCRKHHEEHHRRDEEMKTSLMIQSKFLKKDDFPSPEVLTIKDCSLEEVGKGDTRWVLFFKEKTKGVVLNVTKIKQLEGAYGDDTDGWLGKKVKLSHDPTVMMGTQQVGGIKMVLPSGLPPVQPRAPQPAVADFDDSLDDVPF